MSHVSLKSFFQDEFKTRIVQSKLFGHSRGSELRPSDADLRKKHSHQASRVSFGYKKNKVALRLCFFNENYTSIFFVCLKDLILKCNYEYL